MKTSSLLFSHGVVSDSFATPWTVDHEAPLSMGFPRHGYWSEFHFLLQGIETVSYLTGRFFTSEPPGKAGEEDPRIKYQAK